MKASLDSFCFSWGIFPVFCKRKPRLDLCDLWSVRIKKGEETRAVIANREEVSVGAKDVCSSVWRISRWTATQDGYRMWTCDVVLSPWWLSQTQIGCLTACLLRILHALRGVQDTYFLQYSFLLPKPSIQSSLHASLLGFCNEVSHRPGSFLIIHVIRPGFRKMCIKYWIGDL